MPTSKSKPLQFLIADDNEALLEKIASVVEKEIQAQVIQTSDGQKALELAEENHPSLFILDVLMPGLSGWEVCSRLKKSEASKNIPVLMMTGMGKTLNETTSKLYGADDTIDKPFEMDALLSKVQQLLG